MRPLATVRDYAGLIEALRSRADQLDVSGETLDHVTGLADGYCRKLLAPSLVRMLGRTSLGALLGALGLVLVVAEDPQQLARVKRRFKPRSYGRTWAKSSGRKAQRDGAMPAA
jgi:hypothetical protein